ncbi:isocitrate lyase/phosphoenolpyruvate mutase family protein [Kineosporia sp. A_224]|uniref:isocitrate lyase/PEP mutase family protein n=1 Tax=Kineosporia sp. A_224 TaxID=1962180 RepID=UPI000B4B7BA5|nr:isocitrate lyase/phosphoenolpyruvate mutase family protein [Kineosporia sp. A_224]
MRAGPPLRTPFGVLHDGPRPLVLPNAWDVASARAFVSAGFPAVATTSLGVCAARGLVDGARAGRDGVLALAAALSDLPCPVSVDLEDGYAADPAEVASLVGSLGVAGINLEDSTDGALVPAAALAAKVAAVKARCPDVFVNARVDTHWLGGPGPLDDTLDRALAYVDAGADGVFVPGPLTDAQIAALAAAVIVPLNVLPYPNRSVDDLAALGVRRVSTGSLPYRAALRAAVDAARAVRDGSALPPAVPYADVQALAVPPGTWSLEG